MEEAEGVGAGGGDFAEVARPGEDVLEDVLVDAAEVLDVEVAGEWGLQKLKDSHRRVVGNLLLKLGGVAETEGVAQHAGRVIELRVEQDDCHKLWRVERLDGRNDLFQTY